MDTKKLATLIIDAQRIQQQNLINNMTPLEAADKVTDDKDLAKLIAIINTNSPGNAAHWARDQLEPSYLDQLTECMYEHARIAGDYLITHMKLSWKDLGESGAHKDTLNAWRNQTRNALEFIANTQSPAMITTGEEEIARSGDARPKSYIKQVFVRMIRAAQS